MSTQYNGLPANFFDVLPNSPLNISSSTNATPVVITTSSAHGLQTGDVVLIYQHLLNLSANGKWAVTVVSPTTFSLDGSTPTAIGGASGHVLSLAMTLTYAIPSDGDAFDAAAFNVAFEALGDRTAYLYQWALPVVEKNWSLPEPYHVTDRAGVTLNVNPSLGITYQVDVQSADVILRLDNASYKPQSGQVMEFVLMPGQTNSVRFNDEGAGVTAHFDAVGGEIKFRYSTLTGLWQVIKASTSSTSLTLAAF